MRRSSLEIFLIRHCESQATLDQIVGGHLGCTGLSAFGVQDTQRVSHKLRETCRLNFHNSKSQVFSSQMPRSVETAQLVTGLNVWQIESSCDFCEVHPGEMDGCSWESLSNSTQGSFFDPIGNRGESYFDMIRRADLGIGKLVDRYFVSDMVIPIVFTHSGPILACYWIGGMSQVQYFFDREVKLGSIHVISIDMESKAISESDGVDHRLGDFQFSIREI